MLDRAGAVLLDTSFFMHLLDDSKEWHGHAHRYLKHFMDSDWPMYLSTIAIAEWCVKGRMDELPVAYLRILPFNASHAERAGEFAALVLQQRQNPPVDGNRVLVKNDTKLFAQADIKSDITHYLTSDNKSSKEVYDKIQNALPGPRFKFVPLCLPPENTLPVKSAQFPIFDTYTRYVSDDEF